MDIAGILANIGFKWQVAVANLVNFLIIFWLLKKFLFPYVAKILADRQKTIEGGLKMAEKSKKELAKAGVKSEEIINDAKISAGQIIGDTRDQAKILMKSAESKADEEKDRILQKGLKELADKTKLAEKELQKNQADMIVSGVEKILRQEFDDKKQKALIENLK